MIIEVWFQKYFGSGCSKKNSHPVSTLRKNTIRDAMKTDPFPIDIPESRYGIGPKYADITGLYSRKLQIQTVEQETHRILLTDNLANIL